VVHVSLQGGVDSLVQPFWRGPEEERLQSHAPRLLPDGTRQVRVELGLYGGMGGYIKVNVNY